MNKKEPRKISSPQKKKAKVGTGKERDTTTEKQKAFLDALVHTGGNRQLACERASQVLGVKVPRSSVYHWLQRNKAFAEKVAEANAIGDAITVDLAQSTLVQRIQGMYYTEQVAIKVKVDKYKERVEVREVKKYLPPDYHAAKILLAAKAGHLGYGNHQKIEHSGEVATEKHIQVIIANPYADDEGTKDMEGGEQ